MQKSTITVAKLAAKLAVGLSTALLAASLDHQGPLGSLARGGQSVVDMMGASRAAAPLMGAAGLALGSLAVAALEIYNRFKTSVSRTIGSFGVFNLIPQYLHSAVTAAGSCAITVTATGICIDSFGEPWPGAKAQFVFATLIFTCAFKELRELASFGRN